jgi:hypothetical protein
LESKVNFKLPIVSSFSKEALEDDIIVWSGDLAADSRFFRHPKASPMRGYNSMISIPIHRGDHVVAVFNTIFTASNAFDEADLIYVRLIGAVFDLMWQITEGPGGTDDPGVLPDWGSVRDLD